MRYDLYRDRLADLSPREASAAYGIAQGLTNIELSGQLHVSLATTKLLVATIMEKLQACNRVQVAVAVTKGQFF